MNAYPCELSFRSCLLPPSPESTPPLGNTFSKESHISCVPTSHSHDPFQNLVSLHKRATVVNRGGRTRYKVRFFTFVHIHAGGLHEHMEEEVHFAHQGIDRQEEVVVCLCGVCFHICACAFACMWVFAVILKIALICMHVRVGGRVDMYGLITHTHTHTNTQGWVWPPHEIHKREADRVRHCSSHNQSLGDRQSFDRGSYIVLQFFLNILKPVKCNACIIRKSKNLSIIVIACLPPCSSAWQSPQGPRCSIHCWRYTHLD